MADHDSSTTVKLQTAVADICSRYGLSVGRPNGCNNDGEHSIELIQSVEKSRGSDSPQTCPNEYIVAPGESLESIVSGLNASGCKATNETIIEANPEIIETDGKRKRTTDGGVLYHSGDEGGADILHIQDKPSAMMIDIYQWGENLFKLSAKSAPRPSRYNSGKTGLLDETGL